MPTLFDADRITADFTAFHEAHPEVFAQFRAYAEELYQRGFARYSADAILHRIRWHFGVEKGDRDFALNNNFTSRYARLLADTDPKFTDFFETRRLKTA